MHFIQIGDWLFDSQAQQLIKDDETVQLEPISSDLLVCLVNNQNKVVSKDDLIEQVWKNRIVSDSAITRVISMLRKHLADDPVKPHYIRTIHKQGYTLLVATKEVFPQDLTKEELLPQRNITPLFSLQNLLIFLLFIGLSVTLFYPDDKASPLVIKQDVFPVIPEISKQGQQRNIVLSHNEKWLLFSHKTKNNQFTNLYIKNLNNGKINRLTDGEFNDMGASFSFDDSEIYFARIVRGTSCKIMRIDLVGFADHQEEEIVTCNNRLTLNKVSVMANNQELIFRDFQNPRGFGLYRYHLINKTYQLVTNIDYQPVIDSFQTLSPDGKYLAFLRGTSNKTQQVMVRNLNNDQEETLLWSSFGQGPSIISWSHDSQSIYVKDKAVNQLVNININSGDSKALPLNTQLLSSFSDQNKSGAVYAVYGLTSQRDLLAITLAGEPQESVIIDSSANDGNGVQVNKEELFFVSDRSGIYQFYLQGRDEVAVQLSDFKGNNTFSHLDLHPNGKTILGMANSALFSFDIKARTLTWLSVKDSDIKAPFYNDQGDIFYLRTNKYQKNLYRYLDAEHDELILEDIGIAQWLKNDQGDDELFYQKMNGVVYRHNFATKETHQETYGLPHPGSISSWLATEQGIYFLRSGNYGNRGLYFKAFGKKRAQRFYITEPFGVDAMYFDKFNQRIIVEKSDKDLLTKVVKINLSAD